MNYVFPSCVTSKKFFCLFAANHADSSFISLSPTFRWLLWISFPFLNFLAPKTCICLLAAELGCSGLDLTKTNRFSFFVAKLRCFLLYDAKNTFSFVCPSFWNFYSPIPTDVVRVKCYVNCMFDPARVVGQGSRSIDLVFSEITRSETRNERNATCTIPYHPELRKRRWLLTAFKQLAAFHPPHHGYRERQETCLLRQRSLKRTWRPPHHQHIQVAYAH